MSLNRRETRLAKREARIHEREEALAQREALSGGDFASPFGPNLPSGMSVSAVSSSSFSGPLPPPSTLAAYAQAGADVPERIVAMAEKQAAHRQSLEAQVVRATTRQSFLGVLCALAITGLAIVAGTYAALHGQPIFGAGVAGAPTAGLAAIFIGASRRKPKPAAPPK